MKILRFTRETFPAIDKISSGRASNYYYLCKPLAKMGCENTLLAGGYTQDSKKERIEKFGQNERETNTENYNNSIEIFRMLEF